MTETYKYRLEKYTDRSSRHTCPGCQQPQVFSKYVDESGNSISDKVGRCNREEKCGYHLTPSEFFKNNGIDYIPTIHVEPKPLPPTDYVPEQTMIRTLKTDNNLIRFLTLHFDAKRIIEAINKYRIGDATNGRVIYWQIDEQNRVRTGKIMAYNPDTGHRVKNEKNSVDWVHKHLPQPFQMVQCLYGLHLIRREQKPIAIVESEKSAIIAGMALPSYTWLASGGKGNFRLMESVAGRDVTLFPDLGAYDEWKQHAGRFGFKISNLLEQVAIDAERRDGLDIADFLLKQIKI